MPYTYLGFNMYTNCCNHFSCAFSEQNWHYCNRDLQEGLKALLMGLKMLPKLNTLDLERIDISAQSINMLSSLHHLEQLSLLGNRMGDDIVKELKMQRPTSNDDSCKGFWRVQSLNFCGNNISSTGAMELISLLCSIPEAVWQLPLHPYDLPKGAPNAPDIMASFRKYRSGFYSIVNNRQS
jgi:hypothetical protein